MLKLITCLLVMAGVAFAAPGLHSHKIASQLEQQLTATGKANIIVSFVGDNTAALQKVNSLKIASRGLRLNSLHSSLIELAAQSQSSVREILSRREDVIHFKSFWINNQIYVRDADSSLVTAIAEDPQVSSVDVEIIAEVVQPIEVANAVIADEDPWGVDKIQAHEAWEELGGRNGDGVIVANIDTGVHGSHEALRGNFAGEYGWFDPTETNFTVPTDGNGHGTHTMGIIAGSNGIGVAPGAKWAACKGCSATACHQSDLIACGQFVTCPTKSDGTQPDCSQAPHLVSNSWASGLNNSWYNSVIEAWHVAGIIPVFTIGDSGPKCKTVNSPGDQSNVIGVGGTTEIDEVYIKSGWGPTFDGRVKPDITAPGNAILSAFASSDNAYALHSGSAVAAPHTAGTIALLMTRNINLTYGEARQLLVGNTDKDLAFAEERECGGIIDDVFPNNVFGSGRLNALKSVRAQTLLMKAM